MKVTILGTGCIWTKRACASYLINDDIIVDPGSGTLKQLLKSSDKLLHHEKIEKIKLILITHYHSDHYFDIIYLLWKIANEKYPDLSATIICPPGGEEKIKKLCELGISNSTFNKLNFEKYIKFVDASKIKKFEYNNFEVYPKKMDHGSTLNYGYIIKEKNGKTISFTGDSSFCDNMQYMIDNSSVAFVDMAGTDVSNSHFNIIDGIELMKKYKDKCNIVPCHLTSQALDYCTDKIDPPKDLMVLDIDEPCPYDFEIKEENTDKKVKKFFSFETDKFKKLTGDFIELNLTQTKKESSTLKFPTYYFDVLLKDSKSIIGAVSLSILPNDYDCHDENAVYTLFKGYDMRSIKYDALQLLKQIAKFHHNNNLYLSSSPEDFDARKVYENLGATLKEIKTFTFVDDENKRNILEKCIWNWNINK